MLRRTPCKWTSSDGCQGRARFLGHWKAAGRSGRSMDQASPCEVLPRLSELQEAEARCVPDANTPSVVLLTASARHVRPRAFHAQQLSLDWGCPQGGVKGGTNAAPHVCARPLRPQDASPHCMAPNPVCEAGSPLDTLGILLLIS